MQFLSVVRIYNLCSRLLVVVKYQLRKQLPFRIAIPPPQLYGAHSRGCPHLQKPSLYYDFSATYPYFVSLLCDESSSRTRFENLLFTRRER